MNTEKARCYAQTGFSVIRILTFVVSCAQFQTGEYYMICIRQLYPVLCVSALAGNTHLNTVQSSRDDLSWFLLEGVWINDPHLECMVLDLIYL